jgi:hypothetical protein
MVMPLPPRRFEETLGRSAAILCHPIAAWHAYAFTGRAYLVSAYTLLGYAAVLSALLLKG